MKTLKIIALIACSIILAPAMAQLSSSAQEAMRGRLYGVGEGLIAAAVMEGHPGRIEHLGGSSAIDSAIEKRYFARKGVQVVVLKSARADFVSPVFVEITTSEALRLIDHDWPKMSRAAIISNFGPPISKTNSSMRYKGLAEICSDFIDVGLKDEKMVSVKWTFCTD